jgi:hypothetical protein
MTTQQLLPQLQTTLCKQSVATLAQELRSTAFPVKQLIDLCLDKNTQVAFHAAWILEQYCFTDFEYFYPHFRYFADKFPAVTNASVKRHFAKILAHVFQQPKHPLQMAVWKIAGSEAVAQALFEWLVDPAVRPGVKIWCIDNLAVLSEHHPWIREELLPTIEAQLPDAGAALLVRVRKFLRRNANNA